MNYEKVKIFVLVFFAVAVFGAFSAANASDYKYKILDPQYNSSIENYEYDEINNVLIEKAPKQDSHPLRKAALAILFIGLPILGIYRIVRVFQKAEQADDNANFDVKNEIFALDKFKKLNNTLKSTAGTVKQKLNVVKTKVDDKVLAERLERVKATTVPITQTIKQPAPAPKAKIQDKVTKTVMNKMKNPLLITNAKLANNKGLCLVEFKKKYSLIGYINDEIFMLNKFDSLKTSEIRSRLSETVDNKDRYIVRLGDYKALVEVSDKKMELLLEL